MKITEYLSKNKISFDTSGGEIVIWCPFCQKTHLSGMKIITFHINPENGKGSCQDCQKQSDFAELVKELKSAPVVMGVSEGVLEFQTSKSEVKNQSEQEEPLIEEEPEEVIDISQFKPMSSQALMDVLGLTIKKDNENKIITFLCLLSAYTESSQFNISFNAPSSTGKSYIPLEISNLFPVRDSMKLGNCSPQAFFHEQGAYDKAKNTITVDLSRKIIIFLDQPHNDLLVRLRALLSHDEKEIQSKITDKNQKGGNKTKTVIIKGFPSVIFCSAGLKIDEQEGTRFLLLSPEISQEKIRQAVIEKIKKETDIDAYKDWLNSNPERKMLKDRILAIKQADVMEINIHSPEKVEEKFLSGNKKLQSRGTRDVGRIISIAKSLALLNLWFRERIGSTVIANDEDVEGAFKIWDSISESQELNLPPYIFNLYKEVILTIWNEKKQSIPEEMLKESGLTRQEIVQRNYKLNGRLIPDWQLRQDIVPMLENAGLIRQEEDMKDKRKKLIYPTAELNTLPKENNSESGSGVSN